MSLRCKGERTGILCQCAITGNNFTIMRDSSQLSVFYCSFIHDVGLHPIIKKRFNIPDRWMTFGIYLAPSIAVNNVTAAHAILWWSRATRMIQRFVVGEKYLTRNNNKINFRCLDKTKHSTRQLTTALQRPSPCRQSYSVHSASTLPILFCRQCWPELSPSRAVHFLALQV